MKAKIKKGLTGISVALTAVAFAVIVVPFAVYFGAVLANNGIADAVERELKSTPTPEGTVIVDSLSAAGKVTGNGNGMQYLGVILVKSELSQAQLEKYYCGIFAEASVSKQTENDVYGLSFRHFEEGQVYYTVRLWGHRTSIIPGCEELMDFILDLDIRAH